MIATDEDALICDLAETYRIFDYRALSIPLLATLASGLRDESRIKMRMAGANASAETILLASAVDALNLIVWSKTKSAKTGSNRPSSVLEKILHGNDREADKDRLMKFNSGDDFEAAWKKLTGGEALG